MSPTAVNGGHGPIARKGYRHKEFLLYPAFDYRGSMRWTVSQTRICKRRGSPNHHGVAAHKLHWGWLWQAPEGIQGERARSRGLTVIGLETKK